MTTNQKTRPNGVIARYPLLTAMAGDRPLADVAITVSMDKPSYHGRTEFTLRPGVIDADAIELYGFAKCHWLACAMHDATGWRFGVAHQLVSGTWHWSHAGVLTPGGQFLDIHGVREKAEVARCLQANYGPPVSIVVYDNYAEMLAGVAPNLLQVPWTHEVDPLAVELTRTFADRLVAFAEEQEPHRA